ncbi:MAG TPA: hypothetical protein VF292_12960 [Rhodanobacteraceae bacterium]
MRNGWLAKLEVALADTADVHVDAGVDAGTYFRQLADDIRAHVCEPFEVTASVEPPGFPDAAVGATISGWCVAHNRSGVWLVYQPAQDRFYGFWGASAAHLGARGVYGSPLYCWSA